MAETIDQVKKSVRAVLLSNKKGVLLRDFCRDYRSLLGTEFPWKPFGYESPLDLLKDLTDSAVVKYDEASSDYRIFGLVVGHSYVSSAVFKSQWSSQKEEWLRRKRHTPSHHSNAIDRRSVVERKKSSGTAGTSSHQGRPVTVDRNRICVRVLPTPNKEWLCQNWKVSAAFKIFMFAYR